MSQLLEEGEKPPAPPVRHESTRLKVTGQDKNSNVNHGNPRFYPGTSPRETSLSQEYKPLPREPDERKKSKTPKGGKQVKVPNDKPVISPPSNFEHTVHVGFDPHTGEFTGMPESWAKLLQSANISKSEQKQNPQAVLDVLNYYDTIFQGATRVQVHAESQAIKCNNQEQKAVAASGEEEDEEEPPPPPIAARPDKTKSIYTKPIDQEDKSGEGGPDNKTEKPKKRR
ncbi:hypothetical protein C0Q70_21176 [Pomacea canaliculata]|uniref:non-specific serine/threonine protein kinase n=1 Tax=Pomacea canaliculata TaxID=400727 RepID=A0A2T7NBS1_POMCA|nr:hypothetical protein C0Q70_21176 [Pomacea canaliculata]